MNRVFGSELVGIHSGGNKPSEVTSCIMRFWLAHAHGRADGETAGERIRGRPARRGRCACIRWRRQHTGRSTRRTADGAEQGKEGRRSICIGTFTPFVFSYTSLLLRPESTSSSFDQIYRKKMASALPNKFTMKIYSMMKNISIN